MSLAWWLLGGLVVALVLAWLLRRAVRSARARYRGRRAASAERRAERLLERGGYRVAARQERLRWQLWCDGDPVEIEVRADLLVERDGQRFVGDVKTGAYAPNITLAATRRQLLEYWYAYDVDGVLLIDMESERIRLVEFGGKIPSGSC